MRTGEQANEWLNGEGQVTTGSANSELVIEASVGASYRGDIAIDDVIITLGACDQQTLDDVLCPCDGSGQGVQDPAQPVCDCINQEWQTLIDSPGMITRTALYHRYTSL